MLWGQNVPTKITVSKMIVLVGTILVPMRKQAFKSSRFLKQINIFYIIII